MILVGDQQLKRYNIVTVLGSLRGMRARATPEDFRVVLFGAGQCGRLIADWMESYGLKPLAFCDNNGALWGLDVNGVFVLTPDIAAETYPQATFVVCVREPEAAIAVRAQLGTLNVRHTDNCSWMVTPPDDVGEKLADAFADDASCWECVNQLNWRCGSVGPGVHHWPHDEMYFPRDLFHLHDHEVFADLGAYDGDTFLEFRKRVHGFTAYCGFEPDHTIFARLRRHLEHYPRDWEKIHIWNMAISEEPGFVWFRATGDVSSRIADDGESKVPCDRLDNLSWPEPPTFMKLDIEGSELSALKSGEKLIREHRPILAVCAYHKPQDLWEIPLWISGLGVGYRVYLRRYGPADSELVVYGVPEGR